jgi:hypothetical protein
MDATLTSPLTSYPSSLATGLGPLAPGPSPLASRFSFLWFVAWATASSIWCLSAAAKLGPTFDEPVYVSRGLDCWRTGSHAGLMQLGTMPLAIDLQTLPLYLYERWQHATLDPDRDLDDLLPWARAATLLFWWLLLGYGWLVGQNLAGPWGGRLAVTFLACEPSLLAHAGLATTDIALTACLLAFCCHFRAGRRASRLRRIGVPSLWLGAAILAKASALVFGPLCMLVLEAMEAKSETPNPKSETNSKCKVLNRLGFRVLNLFRISDFRLRISAVLALSLLWTFLYCGSDWRAEPSFVAWAHQLPDSIGGRAMMWIAEHLRIFSNAGDGLVRQIRHNIRGHGVYLLGTVASRSLWYYFPVAVTVKTCLPFLFLPIALLVLRPRSLCTWPMLLMLALLAFSITCRVQIGIRLVLPLIAFGLIGMAVALANFEPQASNFKLRTSALEPRIPNSEGRGSKREGRSSKVSVAVALACVSLLWTLWSAIRVWPEGLCYTNELWGGTDRGYLVLSDSNYDWGQGLKDLAAWQREHADAPLDVWYFGTDPALKALPVEAVYFHSLPIRQPGDVSQWVSGHYLAASTTLLYGSVQTVLRPDSPELTAYQATQDFLRSRRPSARTATFLIYDFRD